MPRIRVVVLAACVAVTACNAESETIETTAATTVIPAPATSESAGTAQPNPTPTAAPTALPLTGQGLRDALGAAQIRAGLAELQAIADANGGTRAAGTRGFDASVEYVARRLAAAGYEVERQVFQFDGQASTNLVAERIGDDDAEVVMLGAHLDSSPGSPGINDNGSGTMTLLATAELVSRLQPPGRTVRFAFWGAEEPGLRGSTAYVASLTPDERQRVAAYLNFDMLGSPNSIRFVYADSEAAPGSTAITDLFGASFEAAGLAWEPIDLSGKSDHAPFAQAGIATGGLFSGGREPKTDAQAAAFGGIPGAPADPCSDVACDTVANTSDAPLDQMADAIATVLVTLASER